MIPASVTRAGAEAVATYHRSLRSGASEKFAEMCALQQPPGLKGMDRTLMEGRYGDQWLDGMPKGLATRMTQEARKAGINISGKFYMGGLADKRGHLDPAAWIDSVADIKKVAEQRDLHVSGIVEHTPPQKPPKRSVDIAPDILRENVRKEMRANPNLSRGEATERVKDRIVPNWKKKKG